MFSNRISRRSPERRLCHGNGGNELSISAGVAVLAVLGTGVTAWVLTRPAPAPAIRLTAVHPGPETLSGGGSQSIVISPDGRRVLYQAQAEAARRRIYVRELDHLTVNPFGGIENP